MGDQDRFPQDLAFLGVDGGGTRTRGLAVDGSGTALHACEGGPTNPYGAGVEQALANLRAILGELRDKTLTAGRRPGAVCLGLAGYDRPGDEANFRSTVQSMLPGAAIRLTNDSHIALVAGAPEGYGLMIVAGTGCIAFGITPEGRQARADGFGHLLGDEGSAYAIGREALRAVCRAYDGRGPQTALTEAILGRLSLESAVDLMPWSLQIGGAKAPVAALAPSVFAVWRTGDPEAVRIVETALEKLADAAGAVYAKLFAGSGGDESIPCVLGGGLTEDEAFFDALAQTLVGRFPDLRPRRSERRPVEGAIDLARRCLAERNP